MTTAKQIGDWGEQAACDYLIDCDCDILERNFSAGPGEIDIIACDDECTVFVEVKTRKNNNYGEPSEYVDYKKQQRIIKTAMCYTDVMNREVRFDVIEVFYTLSNGVFKTVKINHIKNAF